MIRHELIQGEGSLELWKECYDGNVMEFYLMVNDEYSIPMDELQKLLPELLRLKLLTVDTTVSR